jgi:hypothetical protein
MNHVDMCAELAIIAASGPHAEYGLHLPESHIINFHGTEPRIQLYFTQVELIESIFGEPLIGVVLGRTTKQQYCLRTCSREAAAGRQLFERTGLVRIPEFWLEHYESEMVEVEVQ